MAEADVNSSDKESVFGFCLHVAVPNSEAVDHNSAFKRSDLGHRRKSSPLPLPHRICSGQFGTYFSIILA